MKPVRLPPYSLPWLETISAHDPSSRDDVRGGTDPEASAVVCPYSVSSFGIDI